MKKRIFVVEDDAALQELYTYTLENDFKCSCFKSGKSFFKTLQKEKPDLVVLDVMLPGEDGFEILSRLKADTSTANIPVIMVSAKGEELSKVKGLNLGAEDYLTKPFGVLELVARIKANLRKSKETPKGTGFKDISIDAAKHKIVANGTALQTTLKEYNLLVLLCENAEVVQTRDDIFAKVWGENFMGETRTLDIHIKELRRKLEKAESKAEIKTIRGVGYILI